MSMIVKITSGEDKADNNVSKGFELIPVAAGMRTAFERDEQSRAWFKLFNTDAEGIEQQLLTRQVLGNVYVMEAGKTIASFSSADISDIRTSAEGTVFLSSPANGISNQPYTEPAISELNVLGYNDRLHDYTELPFITSEEVNDARVFKFHANSEPEVWYVNADKEWQLHEQATLNHRQSGAATSERVDVEEFAKELTLVVFDSTDVSASNDNMMFIKSLAATVMTAHEKNVTDYMGLELLSIIRVPFSRIKYLEEYLRVCKYPVLCKFTTEGTRIVSYHVRVYEPINNILSGTELLLQRLKGEQKGLVKNLVDKIVKYYRADCTVVPVEPNLVFDALEDRALIEEFRRLLKIQLDFIMNDDGHCHTAVISYPSIIRMDK
jgi:hypothetical protein